MLWFCLAGWTVFVGLALWWSLHGGAKPTVWVVHPTGSPPPDAAGKFFGWFDADVAFQRIYPWALLGPYVALIALYHPWERGSLRLSVPLNLATCVAFVAASHAIDTHTRRTLRNVTIIKSEPAEGSRGTNTFQIQITQTGPAGTLLARRVLSSKANRTPQEFPDAGLTNLFGQLDRGLEPPALPNWSLGSTLLDLLAYGAIVGLAHSVHFYRRFREREHRALSLESSLANARLNALRAQLQPHFLFNSLNAIATLLRRDPRLAEATLMSLSELLRLALSQSEKPEHALREEMEFVQRYLEIQQTRFGDRLQVEQDIEPATLDCLVPTLLLQPLVENAIRHGIEPTDKAGVVRLTARRQDANLMLTVEDNGVGLASTALDLRRPTTSYFQASTASRPVDSQAGSVVRPASGAGNGIGLANLRARLEALYGARQTLDLISRPEGGLAVRIEIPWRPLTQPETPVDS